MSEDKKTIYCTQCGSENDVNSKFCSNCGSRLERASALAEPSEQKEGVFSGGETKPVYEKITDAEEEKPTPIPVQDEIKISYGPDSQGYNSSSNSYNNSSYNNYYDTNQTQYYSSGQDMEKQGGGNIGFAIASLVCGICSLLCCCLTLHPQGGSWAGDGTRSPPEPQPALVGFICLETDSTTPISAS